MRQSKREKDKEGVWIIKSLWEHASVGLDEGSVVRGNREDVAAMLPQRAAPAGRRLFCREICGRAGSSTCRSSPGLKVRRSLPPAEILFEDFAPGTPPHGRLPGQVGSGFPCLSEHPPGDSPKQPRMAPCSRTCGKSACVAGMSFHFGDMPAWTSAWTRKEGPGSWRSMPIRACRRTRALPRPWSRRAFPLGEAVERIVGEAVKNEE